ncbi:unnamed protein product [Ilex paraguariensis]|uniref:PLAT domain-containing protein n=1 Tax=Ilex paraguariensis TaxID=185542 RepID=A0ABC8TKB5_9AQUA
MFDNLVEAITRDGNEGKKIRGTVLLMKKSVLDFDDLKASVLDSLHELLGNKVSLQLISAVNGDPEREYRGKIGSPAYLENWNTTNTPSAPGVSAFKVTFDWEEEIGVPGAFIIKNLHHSEFYLKTLTLEDFPDRGRIHFVCNSWVFPADKYKTDRLFFTNQGFFDNSEPSKSERYVLFLGTLFLYYANQKAVGSIDALIHGSRIKDLMVERVRVPRTTI